MHHRSKSLDAVISYIVGTVLSPNAIRFWILPEPFSVGAQIDQAGDLPSKSRHYYDFNQRVLQGICRHAIPGDLIRGAQVQESAHWQVGSGFGVISCKVNLSCGS